MNIIKIKTVNLIEYENNPRFNDEAVGPVAESIKQFGFKVPIIVDKNNVIITGHTRKKAAELLNIEEVPCIVADDLTPEKIQAFRLVDNKTAEFAQWDMEKLNEELSQLTAFDINMENFGFDVSAFDDFSEAEEDEDFEVELPEEPKTKIGDIFQLGNHRLMCGDSTNESDVYSLLDGKQVDLLITDLPYNVNYEGGTQEKLTIQNDNMENDEFRLFLYKAFKSADNVMKPGAAFYIWHADSEGYNFRGACQENEWKIRQCLIWCKNTFALGRQDYQWQHEPCLYGWKDGASHTWVNDRSQTTILNFDKPTKNLEHPTMKPIKLFDYQIKNNTYKNDYVLDLFAGSGTTLMACEQNNRISFNMEYDPKYCDVIIKRWEEYTGKKAEKIV